MDPMSLPEPVIPQEPRWKRRPEARPDEIIDAALRVFGAQGFSRTKLEDVAHLAGVSKGTLYLYFDSKETLFREMVRAKIITIIAAAEQDLLNSTAPAGLELERYLRRMWARMREPAMVQISKLVQAELTLFPELARFFMEDVMLRSRRLVGRILDRGVANGEFRPIAHNFAVRGGGIALLIVHGAQYQELLAQFDPGALTDADFIDGIIDFVLNGVRIRDDSRRRHPRKD